MPRLSKRRIDAAKPGTKRQFLWDDTLKGFGLVIQPTGKKNFIVQYRTLEGRSRRLSLGAYGALTPDEAKTLATKALSQVKQGLDPMADRQATRQAPTINDMMERYIAEYVELHNRPTTQRHIKWIFEKVIRPKLGHLKVASVKRKDIIRLHTKLASTPSKANQTLAYLSKAFNLAEIWEWREEQTNPVRLVKRYKENERDRYLSNEELTRLGRVLDEAETIGLPWIIKVKGKNARHLAKNAEDRRSPVNQMAIKALRLLLMTGARLNEILSLEWRHVDFHMGTIALPGRKGDGRKAHPVSSAVMDILAKLNTTRCSLYVLPRDSDPDRHITREVMESVWQRVRHHAEIPDVRIHDLRHTVGTYAAQAGGNAFLISHLLRHSNVAITNRYVSADFDPIRLLSESIGQRILEGMGKYQGISGQTEIQQIEHSAAPQPNR
ncbi:tyrosine-type recombinase/integrase [Roseibium sediminis]|uniref:tyrosine-type recombinase/integrase n=1 Tax=Roseibium sediminis TaxID=1775174 RepID=UPI00123D8BA7|nr:site-specific integrase [Roseibium sediminis]